jgi:hypothetical protein
MNYRDPAATSIKDSVQDAGQLSLHQPERNKFHMVITEAAWLLRNSSFLVSNYFFLLHSSFQGITLQQSCDSGRQRLPVYW